MNAEQFRALPSWVSRSELCRVAGLSPNAIRMRVERGVELSESQQKALDAAVDALTRAGPCKALVEALEQAKLWHQGSKWRFSSEKDKRDCWQQHADKLDAALADWKARVGE